MTSPRRRPRPPANGVALSMSPADLEPFAPGIDSAKAEAMIADAIALAKSKAKCLKGDNVDPDVAAAALAIIRAAILRWHDQGTGSLMMVTADVFGARYDNRTPRRAGGFMPAEIDDLRKLCAGDGRAFSIDLAPDAGDELAGPPWLEFVDP